MMVKSAPIWVIPPKTIVEIASTESLTLNFTVRARPEATFKFSFQKNADTIEKIDSSGTHNSIFLMSVESLSNECNV